MAHQHQSRDWIREILEAANSPMTPKQVWDAAQLLSRPMNYSAIRKLLRAMMRSDVRCPRKGHYCLIAYLNEKEINAAPEKEFNEGLVAFIESYRRQRRTTGTVIVRVLENVLNKERDRLNSRDWNSQ